jgi:hypothetical protein
LAGVPAGDLRVGGGRLQRELQLRVAGVRGAPRSSRRPASPAPATPSCPRRRAPCREHLRPEHQIAPPPRLRLREQIAREVDQEVGLLIAIVFALRGFLLIVDRLFVVVAVLVAFSPGFGCSRYDSSSIGLSPLRALGCSRCHS